MAMDATLIFPKAFSSFLFFYIFFVGTVKVYIISGRCFGASFFFLSFFISSPIYAWAVVGRYMVHGIRYKVNGSSLILVCFLFEIFLDSGIIFGYSLISFFAAILIDYF